MLDEPDMSGTGPPAPIGCCTCWEVAFSSNGSFPPAILEPGYGILPRGTPKHDVNKPSRLQAEHIGCANEGVKL